MMAGLGGMVAQGMALGTGSALAHRAVDSVLGSRHPEPAAATQAAQEIVKEQAPCADQAKAFADCMAWANGDMGPCQVSVGGEGLGAPCRAPRRGRQPTSEPAALAHRAAVADGCVLTQAGPRPLCDCRNISTSCSRAVARWQASSEPCSAQPQCG